MGPEYAIFGEITNFPPKIRFTIRIYYFWYNSFLIHALLGMKLYFRGNRKKMRETGLVETHLGDPFPHGGPLSKNKTKCISRSLIGPNFRGHDQDMSISNAVIQGSELIFVVEVPPGHLPVIDILGETWCPCRGNVNLTTYVQQQNKQVIIINGNF